MVNILWRPSALVFVPKCGREACDQGGIMSRRSGQADFPHPALRRDWGRWPTAQFVCRTFATALARSAAPESSRGGPRQHGHSPDSCRFPSAPEVRPLPSTGITRLPRYYEPVRHPTRPGLSLAGVRLGGRPPTAGASRVACHLPLQTCRRHYPGGIVGDDVVQLPHDGGLP